MENNLIECANHPEETVKIKVDSKLNPNDIMRIKIN